MSRRSRIALWLTLAAAACAAPKPPPPAPAPASPAPPPSPPAANADSVRAHEDSVARAAAARARRVRAPVRLAFVGDINLGTMTLPGGVPPDSGRALLRAAKPFLTGDLVVGNFEGVLADSGETIKCAKKHSIAWATSPAAKTLSASGGAAPQTNRAAVKPAPPNVDSLAGAAHRRHPPRTRRKAKPEPARCYAFLTPAFLAPRLSEAGFTHLNLANNHANDFGLDGRRSTDSILASLGLDTYGPLGNVVIDTVHRSDASTIVGIVGFTTYPFAYDLLDIPRSVAVVDSIRPLVDLLVVTFHGGAEGSNALHLPFAAESLGHEQRGELRAWAHAVVDAGADLVVGHGPHVLRGIEMWQGRLVAYSLGNFVNYRGFNLSGPQGLTGVLDVEFAANGQLARARLHPMRQLPLQGPAPDPDQSAARLVRVLSADDFGGSAAQISDDGTIGPP